MGTCQTRNEELSEFSDKFIENFSQTHEYVSESHHAIYGPIQVWKEKVLGWKKNFSDRVCSLSESYDLYAPLNQRTLATELEKRGKCLVNHKKSSFF